MQYSLFDTIKLPDISLSLFINLPILIIFFLIFFISYVAVSAVLVYHWNAYGMRSQSVLVAETLFIFVSAVLFIIGAVAMYYF